MTSSSVVRSADSDDFLPVRALNDFLFCERRCALHRVEELWVDNVHTVEGIHGHQRADRMMDVQTASGVRAVHGVLLQSRQLRLTGKADVIEFHRQGDGAEVPYPVEYKRGKRRRWDNDDVQLCAQAVCLEEMLGVTVPAGAVYHVKSKRRREIVFAPELRALTEDTARRLHALVASRVTPAPVLKPRCRGCSLHELCMPELLGDARRVRAYYTKLFVPMAEGN